VIRCWRLDDARQTVVLASRDERLAEIAYWGARLPDGEDLETIARAGEADVTGGMLDATPALTICPEAGRSFPGQPGLVLADGSGAPLLPRFRFDNARREGDALTLTFRDAERGLRYAASLAIDPATHVIEASATLDSDAPVRLHWLSAPVFPGPQLADEMIDVSGRWCGEFQTNRVPWTPGTHLRESRTGRTGHEHFPGLVLPCRGATDSVGEVFAFHYGWSGGHRMIAEELADGRRQVQFGHAAQTERAAARRFETGTLYAVWSGEGLNGCAVAFQRHVRDRILRFPDRDRPRPVHCNCWEAVYFDHDLSELKAIADMAAGLGAERFVLDDGWFRGRDDDTRALGDWEVDARKYPGGLSPLIDHVHARGMTFGLWFEPEMVSPDSDLHRAHPDWTLGEADQVLGRGQMVLDMARPEVRDHLFDRMGRILSEHPIDYLKWDHNRVLPAPDAAQARGTCAMLDRLRAAFPAVEIESCASGGGRIDFGILRRTHRVWLSDSNDAAERLRMQHEAALFLPMAVTGSHVGPRVCHTSGRTHGIRFRAWVAAQRHMGFEMDPRELTPDEAGVLTDVTRWWKENRSWMMRADILRLDAADPAMVAEQHLAEDGGRFVVFAGTLGTSRQILPRPLRLTRLDPGAAYRVALRNSADAPGLSRGEPLLKRDAMTVSGRYLMSHGLTLPWSFPETIWVVEGAAL
jgi:alpha-galactosidase